MPIEGYINCNVNILQNGVNVKTIVIPVDDLPDECPFCHQKIHPTYAAGFCFHDEIDRFTALFLCPDYNCNEFFLTEYIDEEFDEKKNKLSGKPYLLQYIYGGSFIPEKFDNEIRKLSPRFVKIYNQALAAEKYGLKEVSGIGYRKAIEFLLKDFAIKNHSSEQEKIGRMHLVNVIDKYVHEDDIKQMAHRAVWLGNDEAHYTREWDDYSVKHLKKLIKVTTLWIGLKHHTEKLKTEIPKKKR